MGKFVGAVLRIATIAVGSILGGPLGAAIGLLIVNVGSALLMPRKGQARQASATTLQLGENTRQAVVGIAATAGTLAYAFNYGGKYGTDWEVLSIVLADHECDGLIGFYVNDKYVAFSADGSVTGYNGQLEVYFRRGTETQTLPAVLTTYGGYSASDNGAGICHVTICYKSDKSDQKNPVWPSGRPRFLFVVRGLKCYDPRKDSTVPGGSGPHRWSDPSTREWTDNAIVCRYNWVRGVYACNRVNDPDMLLIGRGLSAVEAPPENVFARANICDELVSLTAGGTEKRYRVGGLIRADDEYLTVEEYFAAACGGVITQPQGCVEIEPGQAKSPTFFFTDADLIVGSEVQWNDFLSEANDEWINTVIPRYIEPEQRWTDHAAPIRRDVADVIADGGPREETLSLPLVTSAMQAGRCGEIRRRMGRLQGRGSITLGPRFAEIEEGDWGVWTSPRRFGGGGRTVRVEAWSSPENGHMQLQLRQISASCFSDGPDFDDGSIAAAPPVLPAIGMPAAGAWNLAAATISPTGVMVLGLVFTGAVEDQFARFVKLEYWRSDGVTPPASVTNWNTVGVFGPDVTRAEVPGLEGNKVFYGAVSYVVNGVPGERRILGPVTTPVNIAGTTIDNLNARNDRNPAAIAAPTFAAGGVVTHQSHADGSASVYFRWLFPAGSEPDVDLFEYAAIELGVSTPQVIGANPSIEKRLPAVPAGRLAVHTCAQDKYLTFGVRAIRTADPDVWDTWAAANPTLALTTSKPRIVSPWAQPTGSFNPYRPASNVAITGDISGTIGYAPIMYRGDIVVRFINGWTGGFVDGQLFKYQFQRFKGSLDVTSSATWSVSGYHNVSISSGGLLSINVYEAYDGYIVVRSVYEGIAEETILPFECVAAGPPLGDGVNVAVAPIFGGAGISTTTWIIYSGVLSVAAGATGNIDLSLYVGKAAEAAGYTDIHFKIQRRTLGGSWVDVVASVPGPDVNFDARYPVLALGGGFYTFPGLVNGQTYEFQVLGRREAGATATGRFISKMFAARGY